MRSTRHLKCVLFIALALGLASVGHASVEVNLTVSDFRFDTDNTPIAFNTRGYNGQLSGPTIRVKQGDTLTIHLTNQLLSDSPGALNTFRLVNTTNLHLHGLHVSPMNQSDDVFRHVPPGGRATYQYQIPADHPVGTFWYHPHVGGSSSLQQGGGMAGALIVGPSENNTLPAELTAMKQEVMLLQHLCFHNRGKYQDSTPYLNHLNVVKYSGDELDPRPEYKFPDQVPSYYLVNGIYNPNITMQPGEFRLFRLIGGGTSVFLILQLTNQNSSSRSACDLYVVAKDGIYVDRPYADPFPLLVPGSRIDLAVRCPAAGQYNLVSQTSSRDNSKLEESTAVFEGQIATVVVAGETVRMKPPDLLPLRPSYMPDLRNVSATGQFAVSFKTEGGPFVPGTFPKSTINGFAFVSKDNFLANVTLGEVQEWQIGIAGDSNQGAGNHPFHMHVNPFQVVAIGSETDETVLGIKVGEYRDTLPLISFARLLIRFIPDRFTGRALVHCHMIPHVDLGMAAVVNILKD